MARRERRAPTPGCENVPWSSRMNSGSKSRRSCGFSPPSCESAGCGRRYVGRPMQRSSTDWTRCGAAFRRSLAAKRGSPVTGWRNANRFSRLMPHSVDTNQSEPMRIGVSLNGMFAAFVQPWGSSPCGVSSETHTQVVKTGHAVVFAARRFTVETRTAAMWRAGHRRSRRPR